MHSLKCSALFIILFSICNGCSVDNKGKKPVIVALLDLHTGENCEIVNFHGLQQLAILQSTLETINSLLLHDNIEIKFLFFDTCSTTKGTMIATLNALVAAEQTCIHTPFFLGFIGNENRDGFEISQSITKAFNITHVLPHFLDLDLIGNDNALTVSSYPVKQHTEAVKIIFEKLGIQNFIILHDSVSLSVLKLNNLVNDVKEDLCVMKSLVFVNVKELERQITKGNALKLEFFLHLFKVEKSFQQVPLNTLIIYNRDSNEDGILIIIENVKILDEMSEYLQKYNKQLIISAGKAGTENFIFPLSKSTFLLQFVSLSPIGNLSQRYDEKLVKMYDEQQFLKCLKNKHQLEVKCKSSITKALSIKEKDWTVDLLEYGLLLFGQGVQNAANKKCNHLTGNQSWCPNLNTMTQKEWHNILRDSLTLNDTKGGSSTQIIRFNMDINGKFMIKMLEHGSIQSIGQIEGSKIWMFNNYKFPFLNRKKHANCLETILSTAATTTLSTTTKLYFETSSVPLDSFFNIDLRDYETIGVLSGIVFGIVFLLSLFVYIIYATVRVKSARSDSSSIGSVNTRASD